MLAFVNFAVSVILAIWAGNYMFTRWNGSGILALLLCWLIPLRVYDWLGFDVYTMVDVAGFVGSLLGIKVAQSMCRRSGASGKIP